MLSTTQGYAYKGKRLFDVTVVLFAAPVVLPIIALISLLSWRLIGAPVLFWQSRAGLHGKSFDIVKFRTMLEAEGPDGRPLPDEARLTRYGRFLRASSLDELPELFNVLKGEMSLVGPRPLLVRYVPLYSPHQRRRLDVVPGLTGLAQVVGRNLLSWDERFDIDVEYTRSASFAMDLRILVKTVSAVFLRKGISANGTATMVEFRGGFSLPSEGATGQTIEGGHE